MALKNTFKKVGLLIKKNSPTILTVVGGVSIVGGSILVGTKTIKAVDILNEYHENLDTIEEAKAELDNGNEEIDYSIEDYENDKKLAKVQTGVKLVKNYILPAGLIIGGLTLIGIGHVNIKGRLKSMTAEYIGAKGIIKLVKDNITEKYGEDAWQEVRYGIKKEVVTEEVVDEDGKKKKVKKEIKVIDSENPLANISKFAKFFDEGCAEWNKDPELNLLYLLSMQNTANEKLKCQGHLFLNEVYDMLGIPRTKDGQKYGWVYVKDNPCGDNYVDFGIYDLNKCKNRDFVNGFENVILLDFNVDGPILELI